MAEDPAKLSLRRLEPAIQKFVKVAIPTDLERLQKHQINIKKYRRWSQWDKLHQEHINASRTVQQLRANVREMETLCLRVRDEDSQALEKIIDCVQKRAAFAVLEFLKLHSEFAEEPGGHCKMDNSQGPHSSLVRSQTIEGTPMSSQDSDSLLSQDQVQLNVPLPQIPQDQDAAESWEKLEENLIDLSNLVNEFSQLLHTQQEKIDSIEDHVSTAAENVEEGTKNLAKAAKYKLAMLPVAGALIGGVMGGPIGLLAGFKVAGVAAAVSGGILGFTGGRLLLKKQQQKVDQELALSSSCPELKTRDGTKI
ncbi:syntaxin-17 [Scyliorhinus canicula]|uniref:syntaxin-17 n=1 Tax=Scyliorhinus canicula TaxID=7830 RepID=UPI0018F42745|nr:syntaxin-17 [Scyliorhinus canicula]XP_038653579.1 syntaxin-17 [Scyliorhinus canicula]XP_038653580.1 syntaxin-17 [Scyliorhinus canicula]